jgi:hypothetical protein
MMKRVPIAVVLLLSSYQQVLRALVFQAIAE